MTRLSGWGRYPAADCLIARPESQGGLASSLAAGSWIPRGLGRSYGDTAINPQGVLELTRLNRFLAFDEATGLLEAEGGASFAAIIETFLPRGWFLPVTPGTKFVTLGGAIANDVHGKNHHVDGSIASFIHELELVTPRGDRLVCSRSANRELFWATMGGIGLTGVITRAKLQLVPVETAYAKVDYRQARNLEAALALLAATDADYRFSVAWIDCLATGASLGRSVLMLGNPASRADLGPHPAPLALPRGLPKAIPFDFPSGMLNRASVGAFNTLFYHKHQDVNGKLVDFDSYYYPLDAIHHWNRMYGPRGFVQYQVALPDDTAEAGLTELLKRFSGSGRASFLAVLKRFGPGNAGPLSFPMAGYTLALDLPYTPDLVPFLRELDQVVLAHRGRLYLAKDAVMEAATFAAMYPRLDEFLAIKREVDPENRLTSSMARRLGLAPAR